MQMTRIKCLYIHFYTPAHSMLKSQSKLFHEAYIHFWATRQATFMYRVGENKMARYTFVGLL